MEEIKLIEFLTFAMVFALFLITTKKFDGIKQVGDLTEEQIALIVDFLPTIIVLFLITTFLTFLTYFFLEKIMGIIYERR